MIKDLLKVRHLITIADLLDYEDYDQLNYLHREALSETDNQEVSDRIAEMYEKYRTRGRKDE